jgi:hypothetical protein
MRRFWFRLGQLLRTRVWRAHVIPGIDTYGHKARSVTIAIAEQVQRDKEIKQARSGVMLHGM